MATVQQRRIQRVARPGLAIREVVLEDVPPPLPPLRPRLPTAASPAADYARPKVPTRPRAPFRPRPSETVFQCGQCDMLVPESAPICQYCGARFEGVVESEPARPQVLTSEPGAREEQSEDARPVAPGPPPGRFDVFTLRAHDRADHDRLYAEAATGAVAAARLLEAVERLIRDSESLGLEISATRRLMREAWEAHRNRDFNLVTVLAHQSEAELLPNVSRLIELQLARVRDLVARGKTRGAEVEPFVYQLKLAYGALRLGQLDEALAITRDLVESIRDAAVGWA